MFSLVLFTGKDPSLLYKSSKRRNHLKLDNLEKFFLLSALKIPIKSVTSYQAESFQVLFFGGRVGARQKGVRSIFQGWYDILEDAMVDVWKLIYENVQKKIISQQTYLYIRVLKFFEVLFYTYCKGLFCL